MAALLCLTTVLLPATTAQSQQSTDVVIDSTGEVIVNDQSDVLEAGFEDLMRRQRAYEQQLFDQAKKELQAQEAELSTLDQEFDRAADEVGGGREARPEAVMSNILSLEECARNLERVVAEREAISAEHSDCVAKTKGSDSCRRYWPLLDAKSAQYEQIDASCQAPGEEINRHFGTVGIARAKARMKALGVTPTPSPNAGDLDYIVPLTPPRSNAGAAPPSAPPNAGDLDYLVPLTAPPNAGDLDYLVPLVEPPGPSSEGAPSAATANAGDLDFVAPLVAPPSAGDLDYLVPLVTPGSSPP
ncbi:MAG: hypothetical protein KBC34_14555 [Phenylobacterium sp.]|nr:hypothetical protein [Phenylobacterium sp.]